MTDREKAIVMAYTGVAMLTGDKLDLFYQYIAEIQLRPVFTHELATQEMTDEIKEKSKPDFIKLCRETTEPIKHGYWQGINPLVDTIECSVCGYELLSAELATPYCAWCGAKMDGDENEKI